MRIKLSERLAALFLSLVMVLSCAAPYGFAAETDAEAAEAVIDAEATEADDAEAAPDAEIVEAVEADEAEAVVTEAEAVEAEETVEAEAAPDAETVETVEAAETVIDAEPVETPEADGAESGAESADFAVLNAAESGLYDFSSFNHAEDGLLKIDPDKRTVTLDFTPGDHFVVYNGLDHKVNSFVWEADIDIQPGLKVQSAALIFGFPSKEAASSNWYGANLDSTRLSGEQAFRLFGPNIDTNSGGSAEGIDIAKTLHFKVDVHATGDFVYSFGNAGGTLKEISGHISSWRGGYLGILTWESGATFSNISFEEREETVPAPTLGEVTKADNFQYNNNIADSNLSGLRTQGGVWEARADGLYSNAIDQGDAFLYSATTGGNFVYSTDVKFLQERGAAALLFRNADANGHDECYAVNIDAGAKRAKMWRWEDGMDYQLSGQIEFEAADSYTLTVVFIDAWLSFYVNGKLIGSTGDYWKLGGADWGQDTFIKEGTFGLLNWNGEMTFQNTFYTPITGNFTPLLSDISVTSSGTVEGKGQFVSTEPTIIQYVGNNASTVNINATPVNSNAVIRVYDADGNEYANGANIPVAVGANYIAVESSVANNGATAAVTYRVNVHRRQNEALYYNELYRGQYHYSVKDGWANDPNGMVLYNGTYHLFYQFYDDVEWGPMHWAHATSTDLVHWKDAPMALYPDANGAMFSGCVVADDKNTSGLFSGNQGGLVALITANGNGQRIKLAYSTDEGKTWAKVDKIAADWTDDPLYSRDFRDPKVFRWENKWFMVIAGGPLRIYSSDNLREWKCESTYATLHTECPDMYPIRADDGVIKWVLSRGGRLYKVGDFKEVEGNWRFVPDAPYAKVSDNGIMNFGKDSYAAMTYYVQDFGTAANPTLPELVEINWMNTWDDYCREVGRKVGQAFNGTFNLNLTLGLKNENGKYVLTQTPIQAYETLRGNPAVSLTGADVTENNALLSNFSGDCYEIVSKFYPGTAKRVGFDLRVGNGQKTAVRYDTESKRLSIDRSQSGIIISNMFAQTDGQTVEPNADGSIDLRIYVDKASVEVFAKDYTAAGANQIFPSVSGLGAAIVAEGGTAKADVTVYPLQSAWTDKVSASTPVDMTVSGNSDIRVNVGDEVNLQATLLPVNVPQNIRWTVSDAGVISGNDSGNDFRGKALKAGSATITATASDNPDLKKTFSVTVAENNFDTNIPAFTVNGGNWFVNDKTLSVSNQGANHFYLSSNPVSLGEFTLETNISFTRGAINIFFAGGSLNPFDPQAYSVQFNDGESFRLFRFGGDDFASPVNMGKRVNDGQYHNVKITKTANSVAVSVDGVEYPAHTFESVEPCYNSGTYVGLGLWDGALDVQSFNVTAIAAQPEPVYRTVKFDPNGGSGSMQEQKVEDGKGFALPYNGFTPPANKQFKAWGIGGAEYNPGALYAVTGDTTVTALWADVSAPPDNPNPGGSASKSGCYVATAVYGSYDCPEVWTLRRFRDNVLAETWYGRLFIKLYYAVSPAAVRLFGDADWFRTFWRERLDGMVSNLQADGFESTPYEDKAW